MLTGVRVTAGLDSSHSYTVTPLTVTVPLLAVCTSFTSTRRDGIMKSRSRFKYVKQTPGGRLDGMGVPLSTLSVCLCSVRQGYNMLGPTGIV